MSMGVNILSRRCRNYIASHESIGIPELMLRMKNAGEKVFCFKSNDLWLDLGRPEDLEAAQDVFAARINKILRPRK